MKANKRRSKIYWLLKNGSIFISCLLPILAICEKFPFWNTTYGTGRSIGIGAILTLIVVVIIFRKSVVRFFEERLKLNHAPPLLVWGIMLIIAYVLIFISDFLRDLTVVFWMGLIGCLIGTLMTYVGENFFAKKEEKDE